MKAITALRDGKVPVQLHGETYHFVFTLNTMVDVEERFEGFANMEAALEGPEQMKHIRWLITNLINEGLGDGAEAFNEKQVGRLLTGGNLNKAVDAMYGTMRIAKENGIITGEDGDVPEDEENPTEGKPTKE